MVDERVRAHEDDYFRRMDTEKIEKAREAARRQGLKQLLAERVGATDPEVLELMLKMGLDRDTAPVVPLLPLVQVAWADGEISPKEADAIRETARAKQIAEGSPADQFLTQLLTERPGDGFFADALVVLKDVLAGRPEAERDKGKDDFVSAVEAIATASGGFLGIGRVSAEEREVIRKVAAELAKAHEHAAKKVTSSV